jgi:hypothetical protein
MLMLNQAAASLLILLAVTLPATLRAQAPTDVFARFESARPGQGSVRITQDVNIRNLINLHVSQQRHINGIKGYRICIYNKNDQKANKEADQVRAQFLSRYEDVKCYKLYEQPFFKVYVGDFRTKSDALRFLNIIKSEYPDNAFIREDIVAFPD